MACWSTKATISLKCVKIEEKLLCRTYRKSPTVFFERYHPRPPTASSSPRLGVRHRNHHPKLQSLLSQERVKLYELPIWMAGTFNDSKGPSEQKPIKILVKRERGRIQGLPKFWGYPQLSQERVKLRTSNFVCTFIGSIETKPH